MVTYHFNIIEVKNNYSLNTVFIIDIKNFYDKSFEKDQTKYHKK